MFPWRPALLAIGLSVLAVPARAVSLLNGSVLTVNGLNLTVSGCSLILAGVTQSSCAAGNLVLQALSSGTGYTITGNGSDDSGADVLSAAELSGLSQVRFTLAVSPVVAGSRLKVTGSSLTIHGSVPATPDLTTILAAQTYSAAAGGGSLSIVPAYGNTGSLSLTPANTFSISNTLSINTTTLNGWGTIQLSSVQQSFTVTPEPASAAVLTVGGAGVWLARRRRCRGPAKRHRVP